MRSALLFFTPPTPRADDEFMSEPRQGDQLGAWLNPRGTAGGWTLEGGDILQDHAVFRDLEPTTGARVTLELHHRDAVPLPALTTAQFSLRGTRWCSSSPATRATSRCRSCARARQRVSRSSISPVATAWRRSRGRSARNSEVGAQQSPAEKVVLRTAVDIDTGEVTFIERSQPWALDWLKGALAPDFLVVLRARFAAAKPAPTDWRKSDWSWWCPGDDVTVVKRSRA